MRANRYVSFLGAEIEPSAPHNIATFEGQIEKAFSRIQGFSAKGRGLDFNTSGKTSADMAKVGVAATRMGRELNIADGQVKKLSLDAGLMSLSMTRAASALQVVQGPLGPVAGRLSALGQIFAKLSGFTLASVLGAGAIFALGGIAGSYQRVTDRLRPLFESQQDLNRAFNDVIGIARRTRQAMDPIVELYQKLTIGGRQAGLTQQRIGTLTETIAKAARLSGGTAESQAAGLTQFGQAFGSGNLGGDELRSIRENTIRLAKAIADGLGVPMAKLKELGAAGKLTPQVIADALGRSALQIDLEMSRLPPRIGQALTVSGDKLGVFIGRLDEATGATTALARGLLFVADHLNAVASIAGTALVGISAKSIVSGFTSAGAAVANLGRGIITTIQLQRNLNNAYLVDAAIIEQIRRAQTLRAESGVANEQQLIVNLRAEAAQLTTNLALIEQQARVARAQRGTAQTLVAANPTNLAGREALAVAENNVAQQTKNRIVYGQRLEVVETELAAAEARLTAVTLELAAAQEALGVASAAVAVRTEAAAVGVGTLTIASSLLAAGLARLGIAAKGLMAFFGGPFGFALTVATGALIYFATKTDEAKAAVERLGSESFSFEKQLVSMANKAHMAGNELLRMANIRIADNLTQAMGDLRSVQEAVSRELRAQVTTKSSFLGPNAALAGTGVRTDITPDVQKQIRDIQNLVKAGGDATTVFQKLIDLQKTAPKLITDEFLGRITRGPDQTGAGAGALQQLGSAQAGFLKTFKDQRKLLDDALKPPPSLGAGTGLTRGQMVAAAAAEASGTNALAQARAHLKVVTADADAQLKAGTITQTEWIAKVAEARKAVDAAAAAQHAARGATAAYNKELRAQETARDKASKLAGIMDQFTDDSPIRRLEKLRDTAEKAKRAIDDLIGERVAGFSGAFSKQDAQKLKDQIDAKVAADAVRPLTDTLRSQERGLEITRLTLAGRQDEVDLLTEAYRLQDSMGTLDEDQLARLDNNLRRQYQINKAIEERNHLIDISAQFIGDSMRAVDTFIESSLKNPFKLTNFTDLKNSLQDAMRHALAQKISLKIFGDPEKTFREQMTRQLDGSAQTLESAGQLLAKSAMDLTSAASSLGGGGIGGAGSAVAGVASAAALGGITGTTGSRGAVVNAAGEVVITASKKIETALKPIQALPQLLNGLGSNLGKIWAPLGKVFGHVGDMLVAAGYGQLGGSLAGGIFGGKQSSTGAQIGGLLGKAFSSEAVSGALGKTLGSVFSSLGNFAGPLGAIVGGIAGSLLGGLFKKTKTGSATITDVISGPALSGNTGSLKQAAGTVAGDIQTSIQRIADQLGGTIGAFSVSIGLRNGKWRVDPTGSGTTDIHKGAIDFGKEGQDAAMRAAILNALQDGAIQGIREGSKRLLQAGKDLESAINKALKFESVFRRLKGFTDPIGAAIDDLNREFVDLYKVFQEAGASASDYAQLALLYEYQRAEAVKQATLTTTKALQDFITENTSGSTSPLGKAQVYANAQSALNDIQAKIAAGTPVSEDDRLKALQNFQDASRQLYGSREAFYTDFNNIMAIAQSWVNQMASGAGTGAPADVFGPDIVDALKSGNALTQEQTAMLTAGFQAMIAALAALIPAPADGSTLGQLPGAIPPGMVPITYGGATYYVPANIYGAGLVPM